MGRSVIYGNHPRQAQVMNMKNALFRIAGSYNGVPHLAASVNQNSHSVNRIGIALYPVMPSNGHDRKRSARYPTSLIIKLLPTSYNEFILHVGIYNPGFFRLGAIVGSNICDCMRNSVKSVYMRK